MTYTLGTHVLLDAYKLLILNCLKITLLLSGGRSNNTGENSHLPFRRRERAMQLFKTAALLQKFVSYHSQIYNHFNHERHLQTRQTYKQKRSAALIEWFQICAS